MPTRKVPKSGGRPRRIPSEKSTQQFCVFFAPSEYLELHWCAQQAGETMADYVRGAIVSRYKKEWPDRLPFGLRFRPQDMPTLRRKPN